MPSFPSAVMLLASAVLLYLAVGTLSNLWSGSMDSPASTYVVVGVLELLAAAAAAAVGVWLARAQERD